MDKEVSNNSDEEVTSSSSKQQEYQDWILSPHQYEDLNCPPPSSSDDGVPSLDPSHQALAMSTLPPVPAVTLIVEPFPTLYWLIDPELHRAVSILEDSERGVACLQKRLLDHIAASTSTSAKKSNDDAILPTSSNPMSAPHLSYASRRWSLLSVPLTNSASSSLDVVDPHSFYLSEVLARRWDKTLTSTGIGGCRDDTNIRCLHMHVAHFLAQKGVGGGGGENLIGRWTVEWLVEKGLWREDNQPCVKGVGEREGMTDKFGNE